jgi:hypothetical protein
MILNEKIKLALKKQKRKEFYQASSLSEPIKNEHILILKIESVTQYFDLPL